jgi:hypothetical protein
MILEYKWGAMKAHHLYFVWNPFELILAAHVHEVVEQHRKV